MGGKDAAYVREDANIELAAKEIASGCFYNSGQCCCAIERVYVHYSIYDKFIILVKNEAENIILGNPMLENTTMGPLAIIDSFNSVYDKIDDAISKGASQIVDHTKFKEDLPKNYIKPHILINVDHSMNIMKDETFAPILPIMKVYNDSEAICLMNDSRYGLTSSVWTKNTSIAIDIGNHLDVGTFYINRCDYLAPSLPWAGMKESGIGCSLSHLVFNQVTKTKSYNIKNAVIS